jgi:hypothetical protein
MVGGANGRKNAHGATTAEKEISIKRTLYNMKKGKIYLWE